jgi:hypothetical protein
MLQFLLRVAALLAFAFPLCAQSSFRWTYAAGYTVTGTSAKLTLQLPSDATRKLHPLGAAVVTTSACTVTQSRNGTQATATAGTVVKNRTANPAAQTQVFTNSDSTGGSSFPAYPMPSGGSPVFDLSDMEFAAGERFTIAVSCTGSQDITISAKFEEY